MNKIRTHRRDNLFNKLQEWEEKIKQGQLPLQQEVLQLIVTRSPPTHSNFETRGRTTVQSLKGFFRESLKYEEELQCKDLKVFLENDGSLERID